MKHFILLLCGIIFLMVGTLIFAMGYHSIDLGQNMIYLNAEYDLNLKDSTIQNKVLTDIEVYKLGVRQIFLGFYISVNSMLFIGLSIKLIEGKK